MPVHWFYNPGDIVRMFGKITKCEALDRLFADSQPPILLHAM